MAWIFIRRAVVAAMLACALSNGGADAQVYPAKTIRIIVPSGPGGPPDIVARLIAPHMQAALAQTVVVEHRTGASGAIGARTVATAEADGYTLLIGFPSPLAIIPAIMRNAGFDPRKDFTAVARLTDSSVVLVVNPNFPAKSIAELVQLAKAQPGKFSFASAGLGNQVHLTGELLRQSAGIDLLHVPFKSGAEMTTAVIGGQVDMSFPDMSLVLPLIREERLRALAVTSAKRRPDLPNTPTMVESGFPGFVTSFWTGIVAPAGTPQAVVEKLNAVINDGLRSPEIKAGLARLGVEAAPGTAADFSAFLAAESRKWSAIAEAAGIRID